MKDFNQFWIKQFCRVIGNSTAVFINPIRKVGIAYFAISTLDLKPNEWHSVNSIILHIKEQMNSVFNKDGTTYWDVFCRHSAKKNNDVSRRIYNTLMSLQSQYGKRLAELNSCIDIKREHSQIYLRLNTQSVNALKKRGCSAQVKEKKSLSSQIATICKSIYALLVGICH